MNSRAFVGDMGVAQAALSPVEVHRPNDPPWLDCAVPSSHAHVLMKLSRNSV
jgi:hypothetical protein